MEWYFIIKLNNDQLILCLKDNISTMVIYKYRQMFESVQMASSTDPQSAINSWRTGPHLKHKGF